MLRKKDNNDIELIQGENNILLVAPHGHKDDDKNTGKLTRLFAEDNGCYAIINETYRKPEVADDDESANKDTKRINLNRIVQVEKHLKEEFFEQLVRCKDEIVQKKYGNPLIFWIHGAEKESIENDIQGKAGVKSDKIKVLVGYGQKKDNDRLTAEPETAARLIDALTQNELNAVAANPNTPKGTRSFCGHDSNNMNQLFTTGENMDPGVQSFQLEFRKLGCRDTKENIKETARMLSLAISALVPADDKGKTLDAKDESKTESPHPAQEPEPTQEIKDSDGQDGVIEGDVTDAMTTVKTNGTEVVEEEDPKVEEAYQHLKRIYIKHIQNAMLECGQYLVNTFYSNYEEAQKKEFTRNKSLAKLIKRIQKDAKEKGSAPSRTWIYDAVNLAIDHHLFEQKLLPSAYGQLGHSHKVNLTYAPNDEIKKNLAEETIENKYTVAQLRQRIKEEKEKNSDDKPIGLFNLPHKEVLMNQPPKILNSLKTRAETKIETYSETLKKVKIAGKRIKSAIDTQKPTPQELHSAIKNNEWTLSRNNVNFQTGCSNACRYCYGQFMPNIKNKPADFKWNNPEIRQKDVEKAQGFRDGRVGFPTSHDITPDNLDDYLTVLGKLLISGNRIMIITKPVLECIEAICQASRFFQR